MNTILANYVNLLDFMSLSIGPDYELSLIDTSDGEYKVIAMRCGSIGAQQIGEKISPIVEKAIEDREYESTDYIVNRTAFISNGKTLRTSMFFIKDEAKQLLGVMCVHFDDSRFAELGDQLLQLCHPDGYINNLLKSKRAREKGMGTNESFELNQEEKRTLEQTIVEIVDSEFRNISIPLERLTQEEKIAIVRNLDNKGVFMIKGAVGILAKRLDVSQASLYRYITISRENQN